MVQSFTFTSKIYRLARRLDQLELHGSLCLLLHYYRTISDTAAGNNVAYANLDNVASPQLAVDSEVEERTILKPALLIKPEANCPDLLRFERPLGAHDATVVPRSEFEECGIHCRVAHQPSP
jgi:hypothetical protein